MRGMLAVPPPVVASLLHTCHMVMQLVSVHDGLWALLLGQSLTAAAGVVRELQVMRGCCLDQQCSELQVMRGCCLVQQCSELQVMRGCCLVQP